MRILLTGGSGFVGRRLLTELSRTHFVACICRPGSRLPFSHPNVVRVNSDLSLPIEADSIPPDIDAILHFAQSDKYRDFPNGADDMFAVNVASTARLLVLGHAARIKSFILASTGSVYEPFTGTSSEDGELQPTSFYAASKLAAEKLTRPYSNLFNVLVFRLFTPYGPGQEDRLIPNIWRRVLANEPIHLGGDSDGLTLPITHVDDIVDCVTSGLTAGWSGVFNLSCPQRISLRQIGQVLGDLAQKEPQFICDRSSDKVEIRPELERLSSVYDIEKFRDPVEGLRFTFSQEQATHSENNLTER